jgi:hypothetical protein
MSSLWDGMESAKIFERGKFMAGNFAGVVEIKKTLAKATRGAGIAFIVEMEIISTNLPEEHPIGSKATWFQKMQDKDVAFSSILAWAAACVGYDPQRQKAQIEAELAPELKETMKHATDNPDSNDFIGIQLVLETVKVKTKKGTDFTRYDFRPHVKAA